MDHFEIIYSQRVSDYDQILFAEDVYGNLPTALESIVSFQDLKVLDIGTGTGRIPRLFHNQAKQIIALDLYMAMLRQNQAQRDLRHGSWTILQGDMRALPLSANWADITIAGWAIGHLRSWFRSDWKAHISQIIQQMIRTTTPDGYVIIIETLGTGSLQPIPPTSELGSYYQWLEKEWNFRRHEIRTDYNFASVGQAIEVLDFFFGPDLTNRIKEYQWRRVPEWTGIWWKKV